MFRSGRRFQQKISSRLQKKSRRFKFRIVFRVVGYLEEEDEVGFVGKGQQLFGVGRLVAQGGYWVGISMQQVVRVGWQQYGQQGQGLVEVLDNIRGVSWLVVFVVGGDDGGEVEFGVESRQQLEFYGERGEGDGKVEGIIGVQGDLDDGEGYLVGKEQEVYGRQVEYIEEEGVFFYVVVKVLEDEFVFYQFFKVNVQREVKNYVVEGFLEFEYFGRQVGRFLGGGDRCCCWYRYLGGQRFQLVFVGCCLKQFDRYCLGVIFLGQCLSFLFYGFSQEGYVIRLFEVSWVMMV